MPLSVPVSFNVLVVPVPSEAAKVVVMVIADSLGHFCLNLVIYTIIAFINITQKPLVTM